MYNITCRYTDPRGYVILKCSDKKSRYEHRVVWEIEYGDIPEGYLIYHKDKNRSNNKLNNLVCVTPLEIKRLISGCKLVDGVWFKKCKKCERFKNIDVDFIIVNEKNHLPYPKYPKGYCKSCYPSFNREVQRDWKRNKFIKEVSNEL